MTPINFSDPRIIDTVISATLVITIACVSLMILCWMIKSFDFSGNEKGEQERSSGGGSESHGGSQENYHPMSSYHGHASDDFSSYSGGKVGGSSKEESSSYEGMAKVMKGKNKRLDEITKKIENTQPIIDKQMDKFSKLDKVTNKMDFLIKQGNMEKASKKLIKAEEKHKELTKELAKEKNDIEKELADLQKMQKELEDMISKKQ